jgi:transposase
VQLPLTTPFPGPKSVLLLDNARIHHSEEVTSLVHSYGMYIQSSSSKANRNTTSGCRIDYLPPYSPDYQPIELAFSAIKSHLRRCGLSFYSAKENYYELYRACEQITPESTWGFFRHTGYI